MTKHDVIAMLKNRQGESSLRAFAKQMNVAPGYLSDIYQGRREPGPVVLGYLDLRKVECVEYVPDLDTRTEKQKQKQKQIQANSMRHRAKHPDRASARTKLSRAVQSGRLIRQPCVVCGEPKTHGHHEDYSKPLDVVWLCRAHHHARHMDQRRQSQA